MLKRLPSVSFVFIFMLLCAGCSIKEDRSECPCRLVLKFDHIDMERFGVLTVRAESSGGFLFQNVISCSSPEDEFVLNVPRGKVKVNVLGEAGMSENEAADGTSGTLGEIRSDGSYVIKKDSECPPVYLFVEDVNAKSDIAEVPVCLKKNYCKVSVEMLSTQDYHFGLCFTGNYCGYNVDGTPLPGEFRCYSSIRKGEVAQVNVPRQADTFLRMQLEDKGGVIREFAIGEYIATSGYDWNADELEDIHILIDYVSTQISFKVRDWEKVYVFDVTI